MFYIIQSKNTLRYLITENIYSLPEWTSEIHQAGHFQSSEAARAAIGTFETIEPLLLLSVANGLVLGAESN